MIAAIVRKCDLKGLPGLLGSNTRFQTSPNLIPIRRGILRCRRVYLRKPYVHSIAGNQSVESLSNDAYNLELLAVEFEPAAENGRTGSEAPGPETVVQHRDAAAVVGGSQHAADRRLYIENPEPVAGDPLRSDALFFSASVVECNRLKGSRIADSEEFHLPAGRLHKTVKKRSVGVGVFDQRQAKRGIRAVNQLPWIRHWQRPQDQCVD